MKIPVVFESLLHKGDDSSSAAVLKSVGDFVKKSCYVLMGASVTPNLYGYGGYGDAGKKVS